MTDIKDALRQAHGAFEAQPDPYGHWVRSHQRRLRNRRIRAGVLAGSIALGVIVPLVVAKSHQDGGRQLIGSSPHGPAQNGLIAYADGSTLFTIHPDGTEKTEIPTPGSGSWLVSWSPNGTELAVTIFPGTGPRAVWVMGADGSDAVEVASGENVSKASWSPDGTRLALAIDTAGGSAIHVVNADGTNDRIVSPVMAGLRPVSYFDAAWSPDGAKIAYSMGTDSAFNIYVIRAEGSNPEQLTNDGTDYNPAWSPDGSQIAFTRQGTGPQSDIYVMNADGSHVHQLTDDGEGTTNLDPAWSPDGTKIVYVAGRNGGPGPLMEMNPDGSHQAVLLHGDVIGFSWQPVFGPLPPPITPNEPPATTPAIAGAPPRLMPDAFSCSDTSATNIAAEPNYSADYLERWGTYDGCNVRLDYVMTRQAACFAGVNEFLTGWPLGSTHQHHDLRIFIQDPQGTSNPKNALGFDPNAQLPDSAEDTGLRQDDSSLWMIPGDDAFIWIVRPDGVERWPLERSGFGCV